MSKCNKIPIKTGCSKCVYLQRHIIQRHLLMCVCGFKQWKPHQNPFQRWLPRLVGRVYLHIVCYNNHNKKTLFYYGNMDFLPLRRLTSFFGQLAVFGHLSVFSPSPSPTLYLSYFAPHFFYHIFLFACMCIEVRVSTHFAKAFCLKNDKKGAHLI